jgi:hypothetical protein
MTLFSQHCEDLTSCLLDVESNLLSTSSEAFHAQPHSFSNLLPSCMAIAIVLHGCAGHLHCTLEEAEGATPDLEIRC